jgi:hypothetical protein
MWRWIKRWRDWAMNNLWPKSRTGPQLQALHYRFEKAGLTLHGQAIPWNAEAVLVEAVLRLRTIERRKGEFLLRLGSQPPVPAESLRQDEHDRYRLFFRLPALRQSTTAELLYQDRILGQLTLPVLNRDDFIEGIRLLMPTLFVRLGDQNVACQTFVAVQCRGLTASTLITSPTSLVPLLDLGLQVEFRSDRGAYYTVPACLCSSQLSGRQAIVSVALPKVPRRRGTWTATWQLGDCILAVHQVRSISLKEFERSLRVSDTRFIIQSEKHGTTLSRHIPPPTGDIRIGPCFLVSSKEPGMAGLCPLQVRAQVAQALQPPLLLDEEVLITDGPTMFAPGTLDPADLQQVTAFELRLKGNMLGTLSLCPAPTAAFTSEGGFKPPPDFPWSLAADEELSERLGKLMERPGHGHRDGGNGR